MAPDAKHSRTKGRCEALRWKKHSFEPNDVDEHSFRQMSEIIQQLAFITATVQLRLLSFLCFMDSLQDHFMTMRAIINLSRQVHFALPRRREVDCTWAWLSHQSDGEERYTCPWMPWNRNISVRHLPSKFHAVIDISLTGVHVYLSHCLATSLSHNFHCQTDVVDENYSSKCHWLPFWLLTHKTFLQGDNIEHTLSASLKSNSHEHTLVMHFKFPYISLCLTTQYPKGFPRDWLRRLPDWLNIRVTVFQRDVLQSFCSISIRRPRQ
jgi:hypothetical protein